MSIKKGKTLDDFRAAHDKRVIVPKKIRDGLEKLRAENGENWSYERDLSSYAGVSLPDLVAHRDQFAAHIVEVPGVAGARPRFVWFASAAVATKARNTDG